jgi:murein L,D-transpeptidase YcbB/YkuD
MIALHLILLGALIGVPAGPRDSLLVRINLPASRLDVFAAGNRIASYSVAVGSPQHRTPTGQFRINEITWNPWWIPPASDWARGEKPIAPGPTNPMGAVKIRFAPFYFIHGSPDTASIGHARSHGCVRMRNTDAKALAELLSGTRAPRDKPTPTVVKLPNAIRLEITYERVEADDSTVTLHPDPYKTGSFDLDRVSSMIAPDESSEVDMERLRAFLTLPSTRRFVIPRSSLIRK